jgi:hypothetical protein
MQLLDQLAALMQSQESIGLECVCNNLAAFIGEDWDA